MDNNEYVLSQICFEPDKESSDTNQWSRVSVPVEFLFMLYCFILDT